MQVEIELSQRRACGLELRDSNYKAQQLLKKIRALLKRDKDWLTMAFQRSVLL
jgi:hypothetical protein